MHHKSKPLGKLFNDIEDEDDDDVTEENLDTSHRFINNVAKVFNPSFYILFALVYFLYYYF